MDVWSHEDKIRNEHVRGSVDCNWFRTVIPLLTPDYLLYILAGYPLVENHMCV